MPEFLARQERFAVVGSTNDVVRDWLAAGTPEVCLAVADEQTAGRGRDGRTWSAPAGAALLLSLGFRPTWLAPDRVWRLAATVSLAMADAAEEVAGLPDRAIRLKWPNDLVVETVGLAVPIAPSSDERPQAGRRARRDRRARDGRPARRRRHRAEHRLGGGRLPARAGGHDDLAARGVARPPDRPRRAARRVPRPARGPDRGAPRRPLRRRRLDRAPADDRSRRRALVAPDGAVETVRALGVDAASGALVVADADAPTASGRSSSARSATSGWRAPVAADPGGGVTRWPDRH